MSNSISAFASNLQHLTYQLTRYYEACDRFCTEQIGVPAAQAYTLLAMPEQDSVTMNALSEKMSLANSTMTHTVDLLVKKRLVERENDPEDRRVVRVRLTLQGQDIQARLASSIQSFFEQIAQQIHDGARNTVLDSFEQVNNAIQKVLQNCCGPER